MLIMSLRSTYQNRISGNHIGNDAYNESEVNIPKIEIRNASLIIKTEIKTDLCSKTIY